MRAEQARGLALVAARARERLPDERALDLVEAHALLGQREVTVHIARPAGARRRSNLGGQIARANDGRLLEDYSPLDHVPKLAHVARPRVVLERVHRLGADALDLTVERFGVVAHEVLHEEADVARPLPERRHLHHHDREAVVEVFAEAPGLDLELEVAVRRADHSHVQLDVHDAADALEAAVLQRAEQLGLHGEAHLPDLIEEDDAALRRLEEPLVLPTGVCERAALVAEERALKERLGDRGAVDLHEGERVARPPRVDRARREVFAGARLAEDDDGGRVDLLEAPQAVEHLQHRRRLPEHRVIARRLDVGRELVDLVLDAHLVERPLDRLDDLREVGWLREVVRRAKPRGLDRGVHLAVRGQDDDGDVVLRGAELPPT